MALAAEALMVPCASAQSPDLVTLYGRVYVMVESVEATGGAAPLARRLRVTDQASLLGVRGREDLGGGLKAFFQLETAFQADQNNTTFATRNSGIGLESSLGSVLLGRWDTPFRLAGSVDVLGDLTMAGYGAAGFNTRLHYTANEARTATRNPSVSGAGVTYTNGPFFVGYAYEKHDDVAADIDESGQEIGATFRWGSWKAGILYQEFRKDGTRKQSSWLANLVYFAGNHKFFYQRQFSKGGGADAASLQPRCYLDSVGYQYNFTRRTYFLALYMRMDNNDAASCNLAGNPLSIASGQDPRGFAAGIRHIF